MSSPGGVEWLAAAVLGALVAVDAGPWLLSMVSRPLPAAALLGLAWGDPAGAAGVGAALELVYAGTLPVGAARYPEAGLAGLVGAALALQLAGDSGTAAVLPGIVGGLAAGWVGRELETWRRARNVAVVAVARARAQAGDARALSRAVARALVFAAALGAAASVALLGLMLLLAAPFADLFPRALAVGPPPVLLAALACGAALRLWAGRRVRQALAAGSLAGLLLALLAGGGGA